LPGRGNGGLPGRGGGGGHAGTEAAVLDEQNIAMTRSLGDFTAHVMGVSAAPDVSAALHLTEPS